MAGLQPAGRREGGTEDSVSTLDTFPSSGDRIAAIRDWISQKLQQASKPDLYNSRNRYIPRGAVQNIMSRERVENILRIFLPNDTNDDTPGSKSNIRKVTEYVCPSMCECQNHSCTGARLLFTALIMIAKETLIEEFSKTKNLKICDSNPAFEKMARDFKQDGIIPHEFTEAGVSSETFVLFCHVSWRLRSPVLTELPPNTEGIMLSEEAAEVPCLELDDEVSLPWTESERVKKYNDSDEESDGPVMGEFSFVEKIRIHPDHHSFNHTDSAEPFQPQFALKIFEKTGIPGQTEDRFKTEFQAMRAVGGHDGIVPLLTAFKYRGRYHLLFPWAESGSLQHLWRNHRSQDLDWYSPDWLISQCLAIADALCTIHGVSQPQLQGESGNSAANRPRLIHGDIKSENILCFGSTRPTLKVTDFGISSMASKIVEGPIMTVRPPEYDIELGVSVKSDIWCLGCLYLDFITWAIIGSPAFNRFSQQRQDEMNEIEGSERQKEDTYFKLKADKPPWYRLWGFRISHTFIKKKFTKKHKSKMSAILYGKLPRVHGVVKDAVTNHMNYLRDGAQRDGKLDPLLTLIENRMLVVDPSERADSAEVRTSLRDMKSADHETPNL